MHSDPYYLSEPAKWIASATSTVTGLEFVVDASLPAHLACRIDHDARVVQLPPGLRLDDYQWTVARAALRDMFGKEAVPEFGTPERHLRALAIPQRTGAQFQAFPMCPECRRWLPTGTSSLS